MHLLPEEYSPLKNDGFSPVYVLASNLFHFVQLLSSVPSCYFYSTIFSTSEKLNPTHKRAIFHCDFVDAGREMALPCAI